MIINYQEKWLDCDTRLLGHLFRTGSSCFPEPRKQSPVPENHELAAKQPDLSLNGSGLR